MLKTTHFLQNKACDYIQDFLDLGSPLKGGLMETDKLKMQKAHQPDLQIPMSERLKSIPEFFGIRVNEEPSYQVLKSEGDFEIRQYDPVLLAKLTLSNLSYGSYRKIAFKRLASYIFGGNLAKSDPHSAEKKTSEIIPMTAPVLQTYANDQERTMAFILPEKYSLSTAPKPLDSDIQLDPLPVHFVAVIQYGGSNSEEKMKEQEGRLQQWLKTQSDYLTDGPAYSAQYDAPFVIPFMKRNEIHVRVHRRH